MLLYTTPSKVTVVVSGTWYETSSPPQVAISVTTGSVDPFCWAAATAATCPGLTQLACAASTRKRGPNDTAKAKKILVRVLIFFSLLALY